MALVQLGPHFHAWRVQGCGADLVSGGQHLLTLLDQSFDGPAALGIDAANDLEDLHEGGVC